MIQRTLANLISGSSAFSKTSLNMLKFMVHILLKPGLENFEHYFTRVLDECSCVVVEVLEFQLSYFKSFKKDAVKVLHSICQQIWKTQQWPQDWKRSVFIPIPKKGNVKECLNYHTIALIPYLIAWLKYWKTKQMGQMFELISVIKISILTMLCPWSSGCWQFHLWFFCLF